MSTKTITIDAATIVRLSLGQLVEDPETGDLSHDPVLGNCASVEVLLPPGVELPALPLGGVWRVTLEGGHDQPDHPADIRAIRAAALATEGTDPTPATTGHDTKEKNA